MTSPVPSKETPKEKWINFLAFVGFSALEIGVLIWGNLTFQKWRDWVIVAGALFFPILAMISLRGIRNDWTNEESDRAFWKVFGWLFALPFILGAVAVAIWILFVFFGWLATIPGWAAVIIILL